MKDCPDVETAVRIFDENVEIGNEKIMELFGCGKTKAGNMKNKAKKAMAEKGVRCFGRASVNTEVAYEAWGIDIALYKRKYQEILKWRSRA